MKRAIILCTLTPAFLATQLLHAQTPIPAAERAEPGQTHRATADTTEESESPASPPSSENSEAQAAAQATAEENRALFQSAEEAYDRGEYDQALKLFELLYERSGHPALLFNMAQAHRMAGPAHCLEAHRLYVQYLVDDPKPPNGGEVRERVRELAPCAQKAEEQQSSPATPQVRAQETQAPSPVAKAITLASGAVLLVGLGMFSAGKIRFTLAQDECPCDTGAFSTWQAVEKVGVGAMVVGGSGLAIGGIWWWASVNPTPHDETVWLSATGTF